MTANSGLILNIWLNLTTYNLQRGDVQSLNFYRKRWSAHLTWTAGWRRWDGVLCRKVGSLPLGSLGLSGRFPWVWEAVVWLVGVNRTEDIKYSHNRLETRRWKVL